MSRVERPPLEEMASRTHVGHCDRVDDLVLIRGSADYALQLEADLAAAKGERDTLFEHFRDCEGCRECLTEGPSAALEVYRLIEEDRRIVAEGEKVKDTHEST